MEKKAAVFLDRDGVLCVEKGYVTQIQDLEIFPYAKQCIQDLHKKDYLAICVTNQSAVARGMMSEDTLIEINEYLMQELNLDAVYYCPHYPVGIGKYARECNCRKPKTGMLDAAIETYGIDIASSYMVGDRLSDIICGQKAGLKTVLLESGYEIKGLELHTEPYDIYRNLKEFLLNI